MKKQRCRTSPILFLILLSLAACARAQTPAPAAAEKSPPPSLADGVQEVSGVVLSGGDTTPPGLMNVPRTFVYQVKLDNGVEINVAYTAYPPSPAGDARPQIKLNFYNGNIQAGDYLSARGTYDSASKTLTVASEGDTIETFATKP
ncbi:hypothetical protein LARV_01163 [Longilinea arvoryzae]|uniref:Uncharacterized protein n=1 Tax=Longilinea arvoryzae TaxID=360412 RepID=A0A0S7BHU9_9CHLR|nr:hypothetical protein [Longilinea arvoryzae]GAP13409.1 hypothetical protein LARV_01163 [Longilinea arvoryzae]